MAKIITRGVIDWRSLQVEECDSFEYEGPLSLAKPSGSPPQPVDPWQQAAAQYGLSTGTARYNADLNRTNQVNPLGSTTWSSIPGSSSGIPTGQTGTGAPVHPFIPGSGSYFSFGGSPAGGTSSLASAPQYTQTTSLAPQFQSQLQKPIDTSGIAGMPGGPSTTQDLSDTRDALYKSQMQFLQPEQDLQSEQLKSQLANSGIAPGSAAYNNEMDRLSREQEFAKGNARTQAITGGGQEQSRLFGLGSQSLENQIAARNAPIDEFRALSNPQGGGIQALTPDISGAFNQQYQGQLAGYNANVASNNATEGSLASLAMAAMMFFSDKRLKENIKKVGKTHEGLPVYTYNYKGDTRTQMGVMAQDVEKVKPTAVFGFGGPEGPKMVDYRQIK